MDNLNETNQSNQSENTADNSKDKKKLIIVIIVVIAIVAGGIVAALLVSNHQKNNPGSLDVGAGYVVVTDENGEPVTDENGNVVTVAVSTDEQGNAVVTTPDGKTVQASTVAEKTNSDSGNGGGDSGNQTVKKPDAPDAVGGVKVTDAKEDSLKLSWDKVKCDGYQVSYSDDNIHWTNYPTELTSLYTKTSMEFTGLKPYTRYYFSVRAYNINEAGASASAWSATIYGDTLEVKKEREISVTVKLPYDSGMKDTLEVWVREEGADKYNPTAAYTGEVLLDGKEVTVPLEGKYKGVVTVWVGLKGEGVSAQQKVGGYDATFDLTAIGIDTVSTDDEY